MIVNKKLDRFKQWAGERMGGEVKTNMSDDFRALETEMQLRHEGMERMQASMTGYVKSMSKKSDLTSDKEKVLPVAHLGSTLAGHGHEFEDDSTFGNCLIAIGKANEKIARQQEGYVARSTDTWLDSMQRSLAQMKEYQAAKKKLESRRLAYDTSLSKMQKAKREDFRVEEEMRTQRAKYDEANEEVQRRMQDIKEAESESVADLTAFLEAELEYYTSCRDILANLKRSWPAGQMSASMLRSRSRPSTAHSFQDRYEEEAPAPEPRPSIRSHRVVSQTSIREERDDDGDFERLPRYPLQRSRTQVEDLPMVRYRDSSPMTMPPLHRVPTDPTAIAAARSGLRTGPRLITDSPSRESYSRDSYSSDYRSDFRNDDRFISSSERMPRDPGDSPQSSTSEWAPRSAISSNSYDSQIAGRRPAPPPPIRAKKPPPPPPPGKKPVFY